MHPVIPVIPVIPGSPAAAKAGIHCSRSRARSITTRAGMTRDQPPPNPASFHHGQFSHSQRQPLNAMAREINLRTSIVTDTFNRLNLAFAKLGVKNLDPGPDAVAWRRTLRWYGRTGKCLHSNAAAAPSRLLMPGT